MNEPGTAEFYCETHGPIYGYPDAWDGQPMNAHRAVPLGRDISQPTPGSPIVCPFCGEPLPVRRLS